MSLAFDEYGRPFIIVKEQEQKKRIKGIDATKANILAGISVANTLRSSLGPKGMDKILVSPDGDIVVTNDGATIVSKMEIENPAAKLLAELSQSQDNEVGDGTTGVIILAGMLLEQAQKLIDMGLHPMNVADGFEKACELSLKHLEEISEDYDISSNNYAKLREAGQVSLCSKIVSEYKEHLSGICKEAILSVADLERKDVNFELIKIKSKVGGSLNDTKLINGIIIDKDISHPQMQKEIIDPKICILTCPFEPPKPKTKHNINITSAEDYKKLYQLEQKYFVDMVNSVKKSGATIALCQWGFDDEANHLLLQNKLPAVRWVGGQDIELIAMSTGARIIPRFEEISPEKLGTAKLIKEISFGTSNEKMIVIEQCSQTKAVSILIRGSSTMICEEAHRSIHDCLCVQRNLLKCHKVVYGGGSAELSCSIKLNDIADLDSTVEQYAIRAFADALEQIPIILAENSGLNPIQSVAEAKALQIKEKNPRYGIDCNGNNIPDMKEIQIYETLFQKKQQYQLANQVVKMILKIDDIIAPNNYA